MAALACSPSPASSTGMPWHGQTRAGRMPPLRGSTCGEQRQAMHSWGLELAASCSVTAAVLTVGEIICMRHAWNSSRMAHGSASCTPRAGHAVVVQVTQNLHICDR